MPSPLTDQAAARRPLARRPHGLRAGLAAALLLACAGCSFTLDTDASQCSSDADCAGFGTSALCVENLCVDSGLGPPGCFRGAEPSTEEEYLNQCTTSQCIPFDNCARLGLCNGAPLPPLVARP